MTASTSLSASPREMIGKSSKRLGHVGLIPAVVYGPDREPISIAVDRHDFELFIGHHAAGSVIVALAIEGQKKAISAMIRDVQRSAVKGNIMHIDFIEVAMDKPVHATVALHLVNDPEGVKSGGVLTVNTHEVSIEAKPKDLPDAIEVDVAALQIGDSLHVSDVVVPAGVTILDDPEAIVASVQAPRVEEEEPSLEAAEPEVIGKSEAEEE